MKKKEILKKLLSQKMELVHLITITAIALRSRKDMGEMNNLQHALKLNNDIQTLIEKENEGTGSN
tara:strand:+ start:261 stop:455 length:195 start_codon:yes stop_codon:yes gene_type:complete